MEQKYRFGKKRCIKQINDIQGWQKKRQNSAVQRKEVMFEIHLSNACKLSWEVNLFDFYVESIAFRIKILTNVTYFNNQQQPPV